MGSCTVNTTYWLERPEDTWEVTIKGTYWMQRGRLSGPPEACTPDDEELNVEYFVDGKPLAESGVTFTRDEEKAMEEHAIKHARDLIDDQNEYIEPDD